MSELIFLKLGGSLITDKGSPQTAREPVIQRAAQEIKGALEQAPGLRLVVGHGSGSYGHAPAREYGVQKGLMESKDWWGYAETAVVAARLNRLVTDTLLDQGIAVLPLQPSASALCHDGRLIHLECDPLQRALDRNLVPVVYGDVAFDRVRGSAIISTEQIFAYLSPYLNPRRIVLAGHVEGVFTADPLQNRGTRLMREIPASQYDEIEEMLTGSHGIDVTGGMAAKVRTMCQLIEAQPSITVRFISGERQGLIERTLLHSDIQEGTLLRW